MHITLHPVLPTIPGTSDAGFGRKYFMSPYSTYQSPVFAPTFVPASPSFVHAQYKWRYGGMAANTSIPPLHSVDLRHMYVLCVRLTRLGLTSTMDGLQSRVHPSLVLTILLARSIGMMLTIGWRSRVQRWNILTSVVSNCHLYFCFRRGVLGIDYPLVTTAAASWRGYML